MKVPRGNPRTKQVESSIKFTTLAVTKVTLVRICPKTQTFIHKVVNDNIPHMGPKIDTSTIKVISSPYDSPCAILVPKH
jgi:hypothetical protein